MQVLVHYRILLYSGKIQPESFMNFMNIFKAVRQCGSVAHNGCDCKVELLQLLRQGVESSGSWRWGEVYSKCKGWKSTGLFLFWPV